MQGTRTGNTRFTRVSCTCPALQWALRHLRAAHSIDRPVSYIYTHRSLNSYFNHSRATMDEFGGDDEIESVLYIGREVSGKHLAGIARDADAKTMQCSRSRH